jgi:hypothetical protein
MEKSIEQTIDFLPFSMRSDFCKQEISYCTHPASLLLYLSLRSPTKTLKHTTCWNSRVHKKDIKMQMQMKMKMKMKNSKVKVKVKVKNKVKVK